MLLERGLAVDHSTLNRWGLADAPLIEKRLRHFRRPHCGSVRMDETDIRIRGPWRYLYRAIDKHGVPVDCLLSARRDRDAAKPSSARCGRTSRYWHLIGSERTRRVPIRLPS